LARVQVADLLLESVKAAVLCSHIVVGIDQRQPVGCAGRPPAASHASSHRKHLNGARGVAGLTESSAVTVRAIIMSPPDAVV